MQKYKTMIIDFKKILRSAATLFLAASVAAAAFFTIGRNTFGQRHSPDSIIMDNIPAMKTVDDKLSFAEYFNSAAKWVMRAFLGYVPNDGSSVIGGVLPVYSSVTDGRLISIASEATETRPADDPKPAKANSPVAETPVTDLGISEENRAPIKSIDAAQKLSNGVLAAIGNETSYGVDINDMLSSAPSIDMSGSAPKVLITHTHATESYASDGATAYDITASDRNEDKTENVVAVGTKMAEVFESRGIGVVHDEVLHDVPSFNGSYAHSLASVTEYMEKYPSIQIVFDIHRDSIVYADNTKAKVVTEINGERTAQLMFVVGTDENGLYNPNWRSNMKAALHFQRAVANKYPKLMRHINLRRERFNGHTSGASMIIEVGTSGNSLAEAERGITLAAECIADYLKSL